VLSALELRQNSGRFLAKFLKSSCGKLKSEKGNKKRKNKGEVEY
jgi:hypothetical protein